MNITYDPKKQSTTLQERGIDFKDAPLVFDGLKLEFPDIRKDYGEDRMITIGYLHKRMVVVVWTKRGDSRHIISMRKANEREKEKFEGRLGEV